VVKPFILSLWSLEATKATVSDVFISWLAIGAYLQDLFEDAEGFNNQNIPVKLIHQVCAQPFLGSPLKLWV
jgi:hypothetical protein